MTIPNNTAYYSSETTTPAAPNSLKRKRSPSDLEISSIYEENVWRNVSSDENHRGEVLLKNIFPLSGEPRLAVDEPTFF